MGFGNPASDRETEELVMVPARELVEKIRETAASGDFEVAHALEDGLLGSALALISSGELDGPECIALAKLALEAMEIEFERACG
jgi:hypothetical protein